MFNFSCKSILNGVKDLKIFPDDMLLFHELLLQCILLYLRCDSFTVRRSIVSENSNVLENNSLQVNITVVTRQYFRKTLYFYNFLPLSLSYSFYSFE